MIVPPRLLSLWLVAVLAGSGTARADGDPDQPLRPRSETPAQRDAKPKAPHFLKPSELAPVKPATTATATPAAPPEPAPRPAVTESPIAMTPTLLLPAMRGYWRDFTANTFPLTDPEAPPYFTRGLYAYLSDGFHDWSGIEVGARTNVADGLSFAAILHHEYRETRGELALVTAAARLNGTFELSSNVGVGNGADFLPVAELDFELAAQLQCGECDRFGLGFGTSEWSSGRQHAENRCAIATRSRTSSEWKREWRASHTLPPTSRRRSVTRRARWSSSGVPPRSRSRVG